MIPAILVGAQGEIIMLISIRVDDSADSETELRSLHGWLTDDPAIRHHARVTLTGPPPAPGHMGGALDVIQLVFDEGFQAASLALAYASWRSTRRAKPTMTIEHGETKITLPADDPETAAKIVRLLDQNGDKKRKR
ncbi:hypothetical protein J5X84_42760 [Streptosporangiaceae bacterium NEAU-GS5]|nr:hypothetical protein [Streptosporangiaceae bacterium NEAU-GS5]